MINRFFIILFFINSSVGFAQDKGKLIVDVNLDEDYHCKKRIEYVLLKNDSLIKKDLHVPSYDGNWIIDSLIQGHYHFKILLDDTIYFSFTDIYIKAQKKNTYYFNLSSHTSS